MEDQPTGEEIKEAYACFGLAYYLSECLHRGLCILYAHSQLPSPVNLTTNPRVEELYHTAYALTLGQVADQLNGVVDQDLFDKIMEATQRRNFLAHNFWFERVHLMASRVGLSQMLEELADFESFFSDLNSEVHAISRQWLAEIGVSDDEFQASLNQVMSGDDLNDKINQRVPRKQEQIIRVWDIAISDGPSLIFESDDGVFWQLCDVGLGWTRFSRPEPSWTTNTRISSVSASAR
jgi:hypothetical protein